MQNFGKDIFESLWKYHYFINILKLKQQINSED